MLRDILQLITSREMAEQGATTNSCTTGTTTGRSTSLQTHSLSQIIWVWNYELKARDYGEFDEECLSTSVWEVSASFE
ncbi:hypothetical protein MKW92_014103 [Papaver armeniacum]|nr:hypothetical protein MKW92_014103 [Papaver armeniacum]